MIHTRSIPLLFGAFLVLAIPMLQAQQKGQWVPGQVGLNAGILPEPGIAIVNQSFNYSADSMTDASGNPIAGLTGKYEFWAPPTSIYYVPQVKLLGAKVAFSGILPFADGSLTVPQFGVSGGGYGYADTWVRAGRA